MSLAVNTPAHLEKLGLLKSQAKETTTYSLDDGFAIKQNELNYLMQVALDKVRHSTFGSHQLHLHQAYSNSWLNLKITCRLHFCPLLWQSTHGGGIISMDLHLKLSKMSTTIKCHILSEKWKKILAKLVLLLDIEKSELSYCTILQSFLKKLFYCKNT